jgi:hypothetical protein
MVAQLDALAHNTLVWVRRWLTPFCPRPEHWGMLRLVRDICHMNGLILFDHTGQILKIVLNQAEPLARELSVGLASILTQEQIAVILGETWVVTALAVKKTTEAVTTNGRVPLRSGRRRRRCF